jgi:hypothetical protein
MWSDPDDVEIWAVSPRGAGWLFGASITREVRPYLVFFLSSFLLRCIQSLTTSTHSRSSHGRISLCRKATNICLMRRWRPCGPRLTTATVVGTWPRFSLSERTARVASRCMVPAEENERDVAQQRTRRVVRGVLILHGRFCMLTRGFSKGQYAVFCVDRSRRHIDFTLLVYSLPTLRSNALSLSLTLCAGLATLPFGSPTVISVLTGLCLGDVTYER